MLEKISKYRSNIMGIAILWIMVSHSRLSFPNLSIFSPIAQLVKSNGFGGVDFFLFVSGFGLFQSLSRNNDPAPFYKRRLRKILPAYFPILIVWLLINIPCISVKQLPIALWNNITGFAFWLRREPVFNWYILALPVFYLAAPVFFRIMKRWGQRGEVALLGLTLVMDICFLNNYVMIAISRFTIFALGMIAGRLYAEGKELPAGVEGILYILSIFGWAALYFLEATVPYLLGNYGLYWYPFILITPGSICLLCRLFNILTRTRLGRVVNAFLEAAGICSLEIYLIHVKCFEQLTAVSSNWFWIGLMALMTVLGYGYHRLIAVAMARHERRMLASEKTIHQELSPKREAPERLVYLEFMRVVACFLVIVNHTEATLFLERGPSFTWFAGLIGFFACKIAVPLFLMISGAVLLKKTDTPQKTAQRIIRAGVPFLVMSAIYYIYYGVKKGDAISLLDFCTKAIKTQTTNAFWYFYLYLGLLCLLPILQKMVKALDKRELQWLLFLSVGVLGTVTLIHILVPPFGLSGYFTGVLFSTYIGVYLCGYYIEQHVEIDRVKFYLAAVLFAVLISFQAIATYYLYQKDPGQIKALDNRNTIAIVGSAICFYVMVKYVFSRFPVRQKLENAICRWGGLTFGIYLFSDLMIQVTKPIHQLLQSHMHVILAVGGWEVLIFAACTVIAAALKQIPFLKRWL